MKLTLLTQNIKDNVALQKGIQDVQNALASINFPLTITQKPTSRIFTSETFTNSTIGQGYCIVPEQILEEVDGTEDIAFLIFDNTNIHPTPLNPVQTPMKKGNCTPCQMCEQWYNDFDNVFEQFFLHEMCHALYFLNNNVAGDITHLLTDGNMQRANPQLYAQFSQKQPSDYYLYLLQTLKPQNAVTLTRNSDNGVETLGTLKTPQNAFMTLELPFKSNLPNISFVNKGLYDVKWTFSLRLLRYTYELQNVKGRSGIRIHSSNFFSQLLGCIALGDSYGDINADGQTDVLNSRIAITKFENEMAKLPFKLLIQ